MEIDHIVAVGLFILVLGIAIGFVSYSITDTRESIKLNNLKKKSDVIFQNIFREDTNISLLSKAYKVHVYVETPPKDSTEKEIVIIDLGKYGEFDQYSITVKDDLGNKYAFDESGTQIRFSSYINKIPKKFTVFYDDDSNFTSARTTTIDGIDSVKEKVYIPEPIRIIQFRKMSELSKRQYTTSSADYHISIFTNERQYFNYGPKPRPTQSVVVKEVPVLLQLPSADIIEARLRLEVF